MNAHYRGDNCLAVVVPFPTLARKKGAASASTPTARGGTRMSVVTPSESLREHIARGLFENRYDVWPVNVAEAFHLDVEHDSCGICGGFFAPVGELRGFYTESGAWTMVHVGCLVEVGNWLPSNVVAFPAEPA